MDDWGLIAIILCCGLFADNQLPKHKLKALQARVDQLEKTSGTTS